MIRAPPDGYAKPIGMTRLTCIGGWGVDPESLRPAAAGFLPGAELVCLPPVGAAAEKAAQSDWVIGWSLGAWCVLAAAARGVQFTGRVVLLAPFTAFCSEQGLGGRCSRTQVRWLRRWLERQPMKALADFYPRAGLGRCPATLPYATEDLLQGLEWLEADASPEMRQFSARGLPQNWRAWIGDSDPLLDAAAVARVLPGCRVVPGAGHGFQALLTAEVTGSVGGASLVRQGW